MAESYIYMAVKDIGTDLKAALRNELTAYRYVVLDTKGNPVYITVSSSAAYDLATDLDTEATYVTVSEFLNPPTIEQEIEKDKFLTFDDIKQPSHYCYSKFEPKDVIREWGLNFNLGNVVKYVARAGRKDSTIKDLKKARQYLDFEIEFLENN